MLIVEAIRAQLADTAGVIALAGDRVYHGARPQNDAVPAVAFEELPGGESYQDMTAGSVGVAVMPIQVNCYAEDALDAHTLREACRLALQNWINADMGMTGSPLSGGVHVWCCIFTGMSGGYEPETNNYVRSIDFDVHYQQPVSA